MSPFILLVLIISVIFRLYLQRYCRLTPWCNFVCSFCTVLLGVPVDQRPHHEHGSRSHLPSVGHPGSGLGSEHLRGAALLPVPLSRTAPPLWTIGRPRIRTHDRRETLSGRGNQLNAATLLCFSLSFSPSFSAIRFCFASGIYFFCVCPTRAFLRYLFV